MAKFVLLQAKYFPDKHRNREIIKTSSSHNIITLHYLLALLTFANYLNPYNDLQCTTETRMKTSLHRAWQWRWFWCCHHHHQTSKEHRLLPSKSHLLTPIPWQLSLALGNGFCLSSSGKKLASPIKI